MELIAGDPALPHTVADVAKVACFSPYHFHRIFTAVAGESLGRYVQRQRVQRGALELRSNPAATVTDVALDCGYETPDGFRRAFQTVFGISPSQWDRTTPLQRRDIAQPGFEFPSYTAEKLKQTAEDEGWNVEIDKIPEQCLACISIPDAYNSIDAVTKASTRIIDWLETVRADLSDIRLYGISWDDPDITPAEKCTFEWAVTVSRGVFRNVPSWLRLRDEPALTVAQIHLQGDLNSEDAIWQYLYRVWLPESDYEPAHAPAREIYRTLPSVTGWAHLDLLCALPIEPRGVSL